MCSPQSGAQFAGQQTAHMPRDPLATAPTQVPRAPAPQRLPIRPDMPPAQNALKPPGDRGMAPAAPPALLAIVAKKPEINPSPAPKV